MNDRTFDRTSLRLSATLLLMGQVLYIVVTQFHADGECAQRLGRGSNDLT